MQVKIKRIDKTLPLPGYQTPGAVAFDMLARETVVIAPHTIGRVPTNLVIQIPEGFMLMIKDRSSTAKKKGLLCTVGFIDQDYCGDSDEILMQYYNFLDVPVTIEREERLAQGAFVKIDKPTWEEVDSMGTQDRGGFGTTG